jgi:hypothetical protein
MVSVYFEAYKEGLEQGRKEGVAAERERIVTKFVVWAGVHAVPFKAAMDFAAAIRKGE